MRAGRPRSSGGFVLTDAMLALWILVVLLSLLAVGLAGHARAARRLADQRAAVRLAEHVLVQLQSGGAAPTPQADEQIQITPIKDKPASGHPWVQVRAVVRGSEAILAGVVPAKAISPEAHP